MKEEMVYLNIKWINDTGDDIYYTVLTEVHPLENGLPSDPIFILPLGESGDLPHVGLQDPPDVAFRIESKLLGDTAYEVTIGGVSQRGDINKTTVSAKLQVQTGGGGLIVGVIDISDGEGSGI